MLFSRKRNSIVVRYKDNCAHTHTHTYKQHQPDGERAGRKDRWSLDEVAGHLHA